MHNVDTVLVNCKHYFDISEIRVMHENCNFYNLQFSGHHSYFREDVQMLIAAHKGNVQSPYCALDFRLRVMHKNSVI